MSEHLIVTVSGLRGIVGENLTASVATDYACAFGTFLKDKYQSREKLSVCIGRDSRTSGQMLKDAVADGLCRTGVDVVDLGIVTTPGVGIMLGRLNCNGGVIITASHNPIQYNGIKFLLDGAMAPVPVDAEKIKKIFLESKFGFVEPSRYGNVTTDTDCDEYHISRVLEIVERGKIAAKKFKVALDSVNGAGGRVTKRLLAELGCEIIAINDEPTGRFAHTPEPIAENLTQLCRVVTENAAQIGFAQDPDADRLAIVDENGNYIGEEYTLVLAAELVLSKTKGIAATNLSTSRMIDDIALKTGSRVLRTAVGEANVAAAMIEHNCVIGGEGNGGVIDLRVVPVRDSLVAIALVLQLMAETGKTIAELAGEIGSYYMRKDKFTADARQAQQIVDAAKEVFADAKLDTTDGCRFDFDDGWLHLRASNTEPVIRVIAEAKEASRLEQLLDAVSNIQKQVLS